MKTNIRQAKCASCSNKQPSNNNLAFFVDKSAGSTRGSMICMNCNYSVVAHTTDNLPKRKSLICSTFTPHKDGFEYDEYYCGCRGWD